MYISGHVDSQESERGEAAHPESPRPPGTARWKNWRVSLRPLACSIQQRCTASSTEMGLPGESCGSQQDDASMATSVLGTGGETAPALLWVLQFGRQHWASLKLDIFGKK